MGQKLSEETKRKISDTMRGRKLPLEHRQHIAEAGFGRTPSAETKAKLSSSKSGECNPMFGTIAPNRKFTISREQLYEEFVTQGHSRRFLGERYDISPRTISDWLTEYKIRLTPEQHGSRMSGPKNGNFVGYKNNHGYVYIVKRDHPDCSRDGYVMEHRFVVESFIGRFLTRSEQVHHLNYQKADNDLMNLVLFASAKDHTAFHKWMDRVGAFSLGLIEKPPAPLLYDSPVLLRGKWVNEITVASFWATTELAVA